MYTLVYKINVVLIDWRWILFVLLPSGRKTPPLSPNTHLLDFDITWLDVIIFMWESVFSLRFHAYLEEKFDRRGAKMPQSPLLQAAERPALAETSVKDPSCKSSSNKSAVNCVLPMEWDPQIVQSTMSVKLGCVCMVVFFTECHSIVNL